MAKMKSKTKRTFKIVGLVLACFVALGLLSFVIKAIVDYTKNDLKEISPKFEVGNLGSDGKFVDDESTLYTKEAFACKGLQVKLAFDNEINYQIFYYDDLDNLISSTSKLDSAYSDKVLATHARLVIIPTNDEDNKISLTERFTYPKQMTVKVAKNQDLKYVNAGNTRLLVLTDQYDLIFSSCTFHILDDGSIDFVAMNDRSSMSKQFLDVSKYKSLSVVNGLGSAVDAVICNIAQFKNTDNGAKLIKTSGRDSTSSSEPLIFEKDTDFILLEFAKSKDNEKLNFTDSDHLKVNSCFVLK